MDEFIEQIKKLKVLFTEAHMKELEKLCDVWRSQVTDNPNTEFFYLGRRSIFLDLKKKIETDLDVLEKQKEQNAKD